MHADTAGLNKKGREKREIVYYRRTSPGIGWMGDGGIAFIKCNTFIENGEEAEWRRDS